MLVLSGFYHILCHSHTQYLLGMLLGLHLLASKDVFDDALLVDDEGSADGAHRLLAVHILLSPSTHRLQERMIHIGNQRKRQ